MSHAGLPLYQVDAFTRTRFEGNPAGVVLEADGLGDAQMQKIARELNNSETAFVLSPTSADHDVRVRFFTPVTEVPICGHATIAAHYVRAMAGLARAGSLRQRTGAGVLQVEVERRGDDFRIWMHQQPPRFGPHYQGALLERTLAALGVGHDDLGPGPVEVVSTGHPKLLVPLASRAVLDNLAPDLAALAAISRETGCNGYHAFALAAPGEAVVAYGRMFAPAIGIAEDPVTGNANGPLGAYLVRHGLLPDAHRGRAMWMRQGDALGRPGRVKVEVETADGAPRAVRIAGDAVIAFVGRIHA